MKSRLIGAASTCLLLIGITANTNAVLVERLGGLAYYDTEADLTWLADADYAGTTDYADAFYGQMTWDQASAWVAGLNIAGIEGWRLPNTIDVGNDGSTYSNYFQGVDFGFNITTHSELSNMYFNVLGNIAYHDTSGNIQEGYGPINTGPFSNIRFWEYWSATEYAPYTSYAWQFDMYDGFQRYGGKQNGSFAWAVHDGDVAELSSVPIPAAVWLFGSGLLGFIGVARRKART